MTRPQVVHMCEARTFASSGPRCRFRASWWIAQPYGTPGHLRVCGTHSRAYRARWPIVSADPMADRTLAWEAFR